MQQMLAAIGLKIRRLWMDCLAFSLVSALALTVPRLFGRPRAFIREVNPHWLDVWSQWIWTCWTAFAFLGVVTLLWDYRKHWMPALGRATLWALRQLWSLIGRGWRAPVSSVRTPEPSGPAVQVSSNDGYYPPLELLGPLTPIKIEPAPETAQQVKAALSALGIPGCEVVRHCRGPVVRLVDVRTPETVRATAVYRLADDLAANLGAQSVSILPVVGSPGVLQVQVASSDTTSVSLRALLDSAPYRKGGNIPLAMGVDPTGQVIVADLTELPHLLVAGATGSGKSYFLRQLIIGMVYRLSPADLRIELIDPKQVEFSLFKGLPHVSRLITSSAAANTALQALVEEMERRYTLFREASTTNISGYNRAHTKGRLPFIVTVVDEFADLMEGEEHDEIEGSIRRLGQKARAAGIHLVVATQRPSVDVITGVIKANLPARVALMVESVNDSRTILDGGGAEKLRGRGDLLYKHQGRLIRGQAANVPEEIAKAVVGWWQRPQQQSVPSGEATVVQPPAELPPSPDPTSEPPVAHTPTREEQELQWVREYALEHGEISRRVVEQGLRISSARASELLQVLDSENWLLPARGPKGRRCAFNPDERKTRLAALRGVSVDQVHIEAAHLPEAPVETAPIAAEAKPSSGTAGLPNVTASMLAEAERLERAIRGAFRCNDQAAVAALSAELQQLANLALGVEDAVVYDKVVAVTQWIKEHSRPSAS